MSNPGRGNPRPSSRRKAESFATTVYTRLRKDIITGEFSFGQKLRIATLCARYDTGLSPVREALNRATQSGLVHHSDLRGFFVAPLSAEDLADIVETRCMVNSAALRRAIELGGDSWEEGIVLAFHRMTRMDDHPDRISEEREVAHRAFHAALLAGCGAPRILAFCEKLFDSTDIYRTVAAQLPSDRRPDDEHRAIMEATLARRADEATRLLERHFRVTAERCIKVLQS